MSVRNHPDNFDRLNTSVEAALLLARQTSPIIEQVIIPHLPIGHHEAVAAIIRRIVRGDIFTQSMLRDIDAMINLIEHEAEAGIHRYWHSDEYHIDGGWIETHHEVRTDALLTGANSFRRLYEAVAEVLDIRLAYITAKALVSKN